MNRDHERERLISALAQSHHPAATPLIYRMNRCGSDDEWDGQFTCRTHGCPRCRGREVAKQVRKATSTFTDLDNGDLAFASVVIGVTTDVRDIRATFQKFAKDTRNLVAANRRLRKRWLRFGATFWLETDAMLGDDFGHLAPDKMEQLGELAPMFFGASGPVWIVTVHGLVAHPGIDHQEVRAELARRWPGHKRVDVTPFWTDAPKQDNLRRTINYALKHECRTHLGRVTDRWPDAWRAEYYADLTEWSRGFQSTRFSISSKLEKHTSPLKLISNDFDETVTDTIEPMPFTHTFSSFPITYY